MPASRAYYAERRSVPWWWWVITLVVAVPSVEVVAVFAPEGTSHRSWVTALIVFVVTVAVVAAVLRALSRSQLRVDENGLWADGQLLPAHAIGRVRRLDAEQTRLVLGRDAHVGARLSIKPWLHRAVQIEVADPADPHTPYWVVASRTPHALAAALHALRCSDGDPGGSSRLDAGPAGDDGDHRNCPTGRPDVSYRAGVEKGPQ